MTSETRIRILCVDDHPLVREGLAAVINSQPDMQLLGQASNVQEALQEFRKRQPDVTLMDVRLPGESGIDAVDEAGSASCARKSASSPST